MKPRVKFCWECGRKFRGNHFIEIEHLGAMRILHKECAKHIATGERSLKKADWEILK